MVEVFDALSKLYTDYGRTTPKRLKLIDAYICWGRGLTDLLKNAFPPFYMLYILITGVLQFVYCLLVGTFPFNAFLAGFISCVASFVLAANLRIQVNPENKSEFPNISPERAFADFIFAHVILHLVVVNFIG